MNWKPTVAPKVIFSKQDSVIVFREPKVVITGSARGIGASLALEFAKRHSKLILWDIDENGLKQIANECLLAGCSEVHTMVVDMRRREFISRAASIVNDKFDGIDILVNNAGLLTWKYLLDTEDYELDDIIDVNMKAHIWTVRCFLGHMLQRNSGHIISICSISSFAAAPRLIGYAASKFGAFGFAEGLRNELIARGKNGITVTTVCPHWTSTQMVEKMRISREDLLDADYVASRTVKGVLNGESSILLPRKMYLLVFLKGFLPKVFQKIILKNAIY